MPDEITRCYIIEFTHETCVMKFEFFALNETEATAYAVHELYALVQKPRVFWLKSVTVKPEEMPEPVKEEYTAKRRELMASVSSFDVGKLHPECGNDEIFICNDQFNSIVCPDESMKAWKTLRAGVCAYNREGNVISGMRPLFVRRAEFEAAGFTVADFKE